MERTAKDGLAYLARTPSDDRRGDSDRGADGCFPGAGGLRPDRRTGSALYDHGHGDSDPDAHGWGHAVSHCHTIGFTGADGDSERRRHTLNTP